MAATEVAEEFTDVRGPATEYALLLASVLQELLPPKSFNVYKPRAKVPAPWPGYKFFAWNDLHELHIKLPKKLRLKLFKVAEAWIAANKGNVYRPWVATEAVHFLPLASACGWSGAIHGYTEDSDYCALSKEATAEARRLRNVHPEVYREARWAALRMAFERRPTRANWHRLGKEMGWTWTTAEGR